MYCSELSSAVNGDMLVMLMEVLMVTLMIVVQLLLVLMLMAVSFVTTVSIVFLFVKYFCGSFREFFLEMYCGLFNRSAHSACPFG